METTHYSKVVILTPEDNRRLLNLCGRCDEHIRLIEDRLEVDIKQRGYTFSISGNPEAVHRACDALTTLYHETHSQERSRPPAHSSLSPKQKQP